MNKKLILFFIMLTMSINAGMGSSDPGIPKTVLESLIKSYPYLIKGASLSTVAIGGTAVAEYCLSKYDKGLSKRQKSAVKATTNAASTTLFAWLAYESTKVILPLLFTFGFSFMGEKDGSATAIKLATTAIAFVGTIYCADNTIKNIKDYNTNKKPSN